MSEQNQNPVIDDYSELTKKHLEELLEQSRNPPDPNAGKDWSLPKNLNSEDLENAFKPIFMFVSNALNVEKPIWAQASIRDMTKHQHSPKYIREFYHDRGRKYHDEIFENDGSFEDMTRDRQNYPAYMRSTSSGYFGGYHPVYEEQWFWPLHGNVRCYTTPLNDLLVADCLVKDSKLGYSSPDGEFNGTEYHHVFEKSYNAYGEVYADRPTFENLNPVQNAPSFYVGLNTVQRAACLWAVNALLIPMLNADNYIPALSVLAPNMLGRFGDDLEFSEFNLFDHENDAMTKADNARIRNKSILLRRMLRRNWIPPQYDKNMSNLDLVDYIEELAHYPEDAWTIPPWDGGVIPDSPAQKFFERVMVERGRRPARVFGRGALWDEFGNARAGLMHAYDLLMMRDALYLVLALNSLYGETDGGYHRLRGKHYSKQAVINYVSDWFGGIGQIKKLPFQWVDNPYTPDSPEYEEFNANRDMSDKAVNARAERRSKVKYPTCGMRLGGKSDYEALDAAGLEYEDAQYYEYQEKPTFYDYTNKEVADFVYEELEELYDLGPKNFADKLDGHHEAWVQRLNGGSDNSSEDEKLSPREIFKQRADRVIHLPFGVSVAYKELVEVIESVYNGIEDFFMHEYEDESQYTYEDPYGFDDEEEAEEVELTPEEIFFHTRNPADLPWYRPVRHLPQHADGAWLSKKVQSSGVFYGGVVLMHLLKSHEEDVLNGKTAEESMPILEENLGWSFLNEK